MRLRYRCPLTAGKTAVTLSLSGSGQVAGREHEPEEVIDGRRPGSPECALPLPPGPHRAPTQPRPGSQPVRPLLVT